MVNRYHGTLTPPRIAPSRPKEKGRKYHYTQLLHHGDQPSPHVRGNRFVAELVQLFAEPGDRLLGRENVVDASNSLTPTAIRNLRTFCEIGKWGICNQRQLWIAVNVENTQILLDKQFRMIIIKLE